MATSISSHNRREIATSANWNVIERAWRTAFAPILTYFSRSMVNDQCSTSSGSTDFSSWHKGDTYYPSFNVGKCMDTGHAGWTRCP